MASQDDLLQAFKQKYYGVEPAQDAPATNVPNVFNEEGPTTEAGVEFAPGQRYTEGVQRGGYNLAANNNYFRAMFHSMTKNEDKMKQALHEAGQAQVASANLTFGSPAKSFEEFLDAPNWQDFTEAAFGFSGEMLPSAAATITEALIGSAIGALVTVGSGGTILPAAAGATAVVGTKTTASLAAKGLTRKMIQEAVEASAQKKALTSSQKEVMEAVYQNHRKVVRNRYMARGGIAGAGQEEYRQGAGTFFGNYAEEGMTDPVSAFKAAGLGVPFAAAGLGAEYAVVKSLGKVLSPINKVKGIAKGTASAPSLLRRIGAGAGIATLSESAAETAQQGLEVYQKFQIDEDYTKAQARLDLLTSAFAGASGGFGIGGSAGAIGGVIAKSQQYFENEALKSAVADMYNTKFGADESGLVQREPAAWLRGQFDAMMDPTINKDSVWVDANSLDQFSEMEEELVEAYPELKDKLVELEGPTGGFLFSMNPDKLERFSNIFAANLPSMQLLDTTLAEILQYPRSRSSKDEWVVEVRDKQNRLVHYHQTNNPKEDGERHLEEAKQQFNNSPDYTYNIVDAETHLTERAGLVTPFDYKAGGPIQDEAMDDDYDGPQKFNEGVLPGMESVNLYDVESLEPVEDNLNTAGTLANPFTGKKGKPWATPNPQYPDELPEAEDVAEARSSLAPEFEGEFNKLLADQKLSKSLIRAFIDRSTNMLEKGQALRIVKSELPGRSAEAYEMVKYSVPTEAPMETGFNREIKRMVEAAKKTRRKNTTGWQVILKAEGKKAQFLDMPYLVNNMLAYTKRIGLTPDISYGAQLQDAFVTIIDVLGQEESEYTLMWRDEELTPNNSAEVLEKATIYTKNKGETTYTFSELSSLDSSTDSDYQTEKEEEMPALIKQFKEEFDIEDVANFRNDQDKMGEVTKSIQDDIDQRTAYFNDKKNPKIEKEKKAKYIEVTKEKTQFMNYLNNDLQRIDSEVLGRGNLNFREDGSIGEQEQKGVGDEIFQSDTQTERWEGEYESWKRQPLSKNQGVGKYSAGKTGSTNVPTINGKKINKDTKVEVSDTVDSHFGESAGFISKIVETANKVLGVKKPVLVFSTQEVIDLGNDGMNQRIKDTQEEVENKRSRKAKNLYFKDYDVIILGTKPNQNLDEQGYYIKTLGHEIGHTFLREQLLNQSLKNSKLYKQLVTSFNTDVANNPNVVAWQGNKGFEEWFSDKVSGMLFDLDKGKIFKATNLAESFMKNLTNKLKGFYEGIARRVKQSLSPEQKMRAEGVKARFAYNEDFAEYISGINEAQKENIKEQTPEEVSYIDRAQIEDILEQAFGKANIGDKTARKVNQLSQKILKDGKLPKWFGKLFDSAHTGLSKLGPVGKQIADFFHTLSGTTGNPGMINEANGVFYEYVNKLGTILEINEKYTPEAEAILEEANNEKVDTEDLSPKAKEVREFLQEFAEDIELFKYIEGKERENFFPRIIAITKIAHKTELQTSLIQELVKANQNVPNIYQEAIDVVMDLVKKGQNNEYEIAEGDSDLEVGISRFRAKLFEKLDSKKLLELGLIEKPVISITEYLRKMTRKVEFEKRGGAKKLQELLDMLPADQDKAIAEEAINTLLGKINPIQNSYWKFITNWGLTANVLSLLGMTVFASVPDAAGPVLRSREIELKNIGRNLQASLTQDEVADLSKSIGVNGIEAMMDMNLWSGETTASEGLPRWMNDQWFEFTQLNRWTRWTRTFATGMGKDFLLKHARQVLDGDSGAEKTLRSERYLKELGVTAKDIKAWGGGNIQNHPKVKTALRRFVDESIVRPNAAERPLWASDPHYALVWQLKSFYYAYGQNIIGGLFREGKTLYGETGNVPQSVYPLLMMAATLLPLTALGWDLRERFKIGLSWILPGISPNDPGVNYRQSQSMGGGDYLFELLDRGGIFGRYAILLPLVSEDKRYGNPFIVPMLGPSGEKSWNAVTGDLEILDVIPGYSQLNTNNFGFKQ